MSKAVVKEITIEVNGAPDVKLTMAQARELHAALNEIFGGKVREVRIPEPYPVYRRPYVWPWREPYWVCSSGTQARLNDSSVRLSLKS